MPATTSPAAVVVFAPATLYGVRPVSPVAVWSSFRDGGSHHAFSRVLLVLGGFGEMLMVAYAFPLAILAIGIPIALFVRLMVETARALWHL
jgi:hypothetical protein